MPRKPAKTTRPAEPAKSRRPAKSASKLAPQVFYSPELSQEICNRIADGESLSSICRCNGMPDKSTIYDWLDRHDEFATAYERARERQADYYADKIGEVIPCLLPWRWSNA